MATPKMVFDDENFEDENNDLINFWDTKPTDDPLLSSMKSLVKNLLSSINIPTDIQIDTLSSDEKELYQDELYNSPKWVKEYITESCDTFHFINSKFLR